MTDLEEKVMIFVRFRSPSLLVTWHEIRCNKRLLSSFSFSLSLSSFSSFPLSFSGSLTFILSSFTSIRIQRSSAATLFFMCWIWERVKKPSMIERRKESRYPNHFSSWVKRMKKKNWVQSLRMKEERMRPKEWKRETGDREWLDDFISKKESKTSLSCHSMSIILSPTTLMLLSTIKPWYDQDSLACNDCCCLSLSLSFSLGMENERVRMKNFSCDWTSPLLTLLFPVLISLSRHHSRNDHITSLILYILRTFLRKDSRFIPVIDTKSHDLLPPKNNSSFYPLWIALLSFSFHQDFLSFWFLRFGSRVVVLNKVHTLTKP